jgi:hypothetical protein
MNENAHYVGELLYSLNTGYGIITNIREHGVTIYWYNLGTYSADNYDWANTFKNFLNSKLQGEL